MKAVFEYIKKPETVWKVLVAVFALWVIYATLNNRISNVEQKIQAIENLDLWTKLSRIETDIQWIKATLSSNDK